MKKDAQRDFVEQYRRAVRAQGTLTCLDPMAEWPDGVGFPKHFRMPRAEHWPNGVWPSFVSVAKPVTRKR